LPETYIGLRDAGVVSKGMIPKIDNAFSAVAAGVKSVTIKHADNLLSDIGTVIRL
jgi:acetylglutamate kinase